VEWLDNVGVGVAAVGCLCVVVSMFIRFLSNHMSWMTRTMQNLVNVTQQLAAKIERCHEYKDK